MSPVKTMNLYLSKIIGGIVTLCACTCVERDLGGFPFKMCRLGQIISSAATTSNSVTGELRKSFDLIFLK